MSERPESFLTRWERVIKGDDKAVAAHPEDAEEVATKLEALGNTLSSRAKQYAGCSWLPDPSRPVAASMPGMWEYQQAALCAEAAAALRRYAGGGVVVPKRLTQEMLDAACKVEDTEHGGIDGYLQDVWDAFIEAAARASSAR